MHSWMDLLLPFALGTVLGSCAIFLYFRSKLRIYKYLIAQRLSEVNRQIVHAHASAHERVNAA